MMLITTRHDETKFIPGDYKTYNGITLGMIEGSVVDSKVKVHAKENSFTYRARFYKDYDELKKALESKEIDAIAASSLRKIGNEKIISEFDTSYFYIMVRKGNTELLNKINHAITQMNNNEGDWKSELYHKNYRMNKSINLIFSEEELDFIAKHSGQGKPISIAVDSDWEPFSWRKDGQYKGILPEFIGKCMEMCGMDYVFYTGCADIHERIKK